MDNENESRIMGVIQRYRKGGWSNTAMAVALALGGNGNINESSGSNENTSSDASVVRT